VTALGKLDLEPLAEAVVRRGQEMNFQPGQVIGLG
jgi:hypothetical protein